MRNRFALLVAVAVLATLLSNQVASAAPLISTAEVFAADCNDDGVVSIIADTSYVGGVGLIKRQCSIQREANTTVEFNDVRLKGKGIVAINSAGSAAIRIIDSELQIQGVVELTSGCCSGAWTGVDERGGRILIRNSEITATHIALSASTSDSGGYIWIRDSVITSTENRGIGNGISMSVGDRGAVDVNGSKFTSLRPARFTSEKGAKTYVYYSWFNRTPFASTGPGGACRAVGNTPSFSCS